IAVPKLLEKTYARDCASGRWAELAAELHAAVVPTPPPAALAQAKRKGARSYKVRKGDTLAAISRKSGCGSVREIAKANNLRAPNCPLRIGQSLTLPNCPR